MEESFNIKRFNALFLRYWAEQKTVLMLLIALSVPIVYFYETGNGRIQIAGGFFTGALSVFMILFLVVAFRSVDKKERLGYFLLLPASGLEKFLFLLLSGVFIPYLMFLSELYFIKGILQLVPFDRLRRVEEVANMSDFNSFKAFFATSFVFFVIITIRLLQKGGTILRSIFMLLGGVLLLSIVNDLVVMKYIGDLVKADPFGKMFFTTNDKLEIDGGLYADFLPYSAVLFGCFLVGLFYLAFLKFRELEKGL